MSGCDPTFNLWKASSSFTFDATDGDTLDLSYTRVFGNMNLGLVVLSADNEVFFQAGLVTAESLATIFTLPTAGESTIGVLRISLVEPDLAQRAALRQQDNVPTVFQLRGSLTTNLESNEWEGAANSLLPQFAVTAPTP